MSMTRFFDPSRFSAPAKAACVAAGVGVLSACGAVGSAYTSPLGFGPDGTTVADYRDVYPISVDLQPFLIEVEAEADILSDVDVARVDAFGRAFRSAGEGEVTIAYPSDVDAHSIVMAIAGRLERQGVVDDQIVVGAYSREADGDRGVVVSYFAPDATGPDCDGDLWGDTRAAPTNAGSVRTGCWAQRNFAAMAAQPRDLVEPRPTTPALAERRAQVLTQYVAGRATASELNRERTGTTD